MKKLIFLSLSILALSLSNCEKPEEPDEIMDFAYPPVEMLRYFDFPEGSWWAYKCINDSTIDTFCLYEQNAPGRLRTDRYSDGAYYKTAVYGFAHKNQNNMYSLDTFGYAISPSGYIDPNDEKKHRFFKSIMNPFLGQFNPHEEMYYPISDSSYVEELNDYRYIHDTNIQGTAYSEVLLLKNTWETPTIPVLFEDKYYVKDVGIVKYTLNNGYEYELINHSLN